MIECPRCKHEMQPDGIEEEDTGETQCSECDFDFYVEVDYNPIYTSTCINHEWGEWELFERKNKEPVECRFCSYCGKCQLKESFDGREY